MPRALRIAMALPGLHRVNRGAETAFEQIARELAHLGHDVTLFGSGPPKADQPYHFCHVPSVPREYFEGWPKIPCLRSHYAWEELTFIPGLLLKCRPSQFDITLACSYPYMNWLLRRGTDSNQTKHVFITQNGDWMVQSKDAEYRFFDCDGLVCTNAQYFARHGERYPSALIPNGVNPDVFFSGPGDRAAYGLPAQGKIVLMVSALIPSKRVIEGVRAVAKIPDAFLAIAGDGECRDEVDQEARHLLPGRYSRFTLPREKMPGLYRCADAFLHMSHDEASANAYMEALATGLPIVTHDWEVTRWTLENCAHLVNCGDANAVVNALRNAIAEKSTDAIAKRRDLVSRRFSWSSIANSYCDFFHKLCEPAGFMPPIAPADKPLDDVGIVAIGRNEGQRLVRCLQSVAKRARAVVYVDSGSSDDSVSEARRLGAEVVTLDSSVAFSAARARNAGVDRLVQIAPSVKYVQFIDGDCEVRPGWLRRAQRELESDDKTAAVCGRRRERFPHRSIYNRLIDLEWDTPVGPARNVGGDAMFRLDAFRSVKGFDPTVTAGEEPELCLRLRHSNWTLRRVAAEMTLHDAAMIRFTQWWRRQVRGGYGALDVHTRFNLEGERLFAKPTRSARVWAAGWPLGILLAACLGGIVAGKVGAITGALLIFLVLPAQIARISLAGLRRGLPPRAAAGFGLLTLLSKWAWFIGQIRYMRDRMHGQKAQLIEYKQTPRPAEVTL